MSAAQNPPAEAVLDEDVESSCPPSAPPSDSSTASAGEAATRLCIRCHEACPAQWRCCDACSLPETVRRRNGRLGAVNAGNASRALTAVISRLELSEYSQRIEDAIASLEKHARRALKLAIDADAGVRPLRRST